MSQDLTQELIGLWQELQMAFKRTRPIEKVRAAMLLSMIQLYALTEDIENSKDSEKRRKWIHEYDRQKESIRKGIQMLFESARARETATAACRALP
jgi:HJR/Mrr/RecB family endonuclease